MFDYTSATLGSAQDWARQQGRNWGVSAPHLTGWLQNGGDLLGDTDTGHAVLASTPTSACSPSTSGPTASGCSAWTTSSETAA